MNSVAPRTKANPIRVLNDNFRTTFVGGQVVMTAGVDALPLDVANRYDQYKDWLRTLEIRARTR